MQNQIARDPKGAKALRELGETELPEVPVYDLVAFPFQTVDLGCSCALVDPWNAREQRLSSYTRIQIQNLVDQNRLNETVGRPSNIHS